MQTAIFQEPFELFAQWFKKAQDNKSIVEPTAMCISTVDESGKPSSRMVLLKHFDKKGFCFYTNLTSRKARQLEENSNIALCFYWGALGYQVRIEGKVEQVTQQEADDYFSSRRRESQISAWASKQSYKMKNEDDLTTRIAEVTKSFKDQDSVPRPPFWSGYRVVPSRIEFWQEGEFRTHDRKSYKISKDKKSWKTNILYP